MAVDEIVLSVQMREFGPEGQGLGLAGRDSRSFLLPEFPEQSPNPTLARLDFPAGFAEPPPLLRSP